MLLVELQYLGLDLVASVSLSYLSQKWSWQHTLQGITLLGQLLMSIYAYLASPASLSVLLQLLDLVLQVPVLQNEMACFFFQILQLLE